MRSGVETNYLPSDRGGFPNPLNLFRRKEKVIPQEISDRQEELQRITDAGGFDLLTDHAKQLWVSGDKFAIVIKTTFRPPVQSFWDLEVIIEKVPGTDTNKKISSSSKGIALEAPARASRPSVLFTQEEKDAKPRWKRLKDIGFSKDDLAEYRESGLLEQDILTLQSIQSTEVPIEEQIRIARLLAKRHPDIRYRYGSEVEYKAKFVPSHE